MKFGICNEQFEGWEFDRICRFVRQAGYDGLELAPFTLGSVITDVSRDTRAELRRRAADAGVEILGLHWLLARTQGFYLTSPDAAVRLRTSAYLRELAQACHDLGGRVMVFGSPQQRSLLAGVTREAAFGLAADTFRGLLPVLADLGVTLCMEPLAPAETDFVNTCEEAVRLVEMLDHPNFVLHLDVKAMASEPAPIAELTRRYAGRAGHFHANDPNRRGPGFGAVDFVPIFQALRDAGYGGWISVEVFDYSPDPETIALESIAYMRRALAGDTAVTAN